ncbi:beta-1,3-galactosyl-O-glycosyl-glycoprotein beta-1,6-N-acetylglucosaminyltransferase-like [Haliotis rufescens]|uniref:beta-1,3-galactosyl-O-glycosyl-glycoprotein beta-1,6-N-acetylglucosaminyltransferase-like n=1 Tax=Haliotis rufescens TaxID=6454 RepID=UPI00201F39E1|nr:beta-1,3-galactosyl-O-glycosyl-glycoprotein beta-1,6-N-acetylglucosaminyltransferase-like [Haliotis rufescens]
MVSRNVILVYMGAGIIVLGLIGSTYFYHGLVVNTRWVDLTRPRHFTLKSIDVTNTSVHLHGVLSKSLTETEHEVAIQIDDQLLKKLVQPSIATKAYFRYVPRQVRTADCKLLVNGDQENISKAKMSTVGPPLNISVATEKCDAFKLRRGYITDSLSEEEREFPVAFSILMFKDANQVERLLRAIYRPQNFYCVHVDTKTKPEVRKAMTSLARCFDNVFLSSRSVSVRWGEYTVLEPELICMEDLWHYKWKYFINLTGQEFPLKTNAQLVKILTAYNGANDLEGTVKRANKHRWRHAGPPPHSITAVKGSVHIVASRGFVDYILHNSTAQDLLAWVKKTSVPDETFFSTLNHNPHLAVPGAYNGPPDNPKNPFLARFKNWYGQKIGNWSCTGKLVHSVCVFGAGDLPMLTTRPHLFANKFYWDFQHLALDCLEEWNYNQTRDEFLGESTFNASYYKTLEFVKNKIE